MWYNNHLILYVLGWQQGSSHFTHMHPKLSTYLKDNNCSVIFVKQARAFSSWKLIPFYDLLRGFCHSSVGKESAGNAGDPGSIPGWGRSSGEVNGNPLQYSCLKNPIDRGTWQATVHGIARVIHDLVTKPPPPHGMLITSRFKSHASKSDRLVKVCHFVQESTVDSLPHTKKTLTYFKGTAIKKDII